MLTPTYRDGDVVLVPTKAGVPVRAIVLDVFTGPAGQRARVAREDDHRIGDCPVTLLRPCCTRTDCLSRPDSGWNDGLCDVHSHEADLLEFHGTVLADHVLRTADATLDLPVNTNAYEARLAPPTKRPSR